MNVAIVLFLVFQRFITLDLCLDDFLDHFIPEAPGGPVAGRRVTGSYSICPITQLL